MSSPAAIDEVLPGSQEDNTPRSAIPPVGPRDQSKGPTFKDQMRPHAGTRVPSPPALFVRAFPVPGSLEPQPQPQQQAANQQPADPPGLVSTPRSATGAAHQPHPQQHALGISLSISKKKCYIIAAIVVVLLAGSVAVASICGAGYCNRPTPAPRTVSEIMEITSFLNNITFTGRLLQYPNNSTAEERALLWLIDVDRGTSESDTIVLRQRYALATLWFQTPTGFGSSGWATGITECDWQGVDCDDAGRLVTGLFLSGDSVVGGRIPADLGLLTDLDYLGLYDNALTGTIPSSIGSLTDLTELHLSGNALNGTIPSSLGSLTALTWLDLPSNALTGTIPSSIASLTDLIILALRGNALNGTIPSSIGLLTALNYLTLDRNALMGTIPPSINSLTDLNDLSLSENALNGTIPATIVSLTDLTEFHVYNNSLTGTMPFCDSGSNQSFDFLVADCGKVSCPCCTHCCPTSRDGIPVWDYC